MRGGFAEVLRYSYDVAPQRCVDMPTRLQITAFFFIRAIVSRKSEQFLRKMEQKKPARGVRGRVGAYDERERGARRALSFLYVCVIEEMRVSCYDVCSRKLPIRERVVGLILRCFVA